MWKEAYERYSGVCSNVDILMNNQTAHKIIRKKVDLKLGMHEVAIYKRLNATPTNVFPRLIDYEIMGNHMMLYLTLVEGKTLDRSFKDVVLTNGGETLISQTIEALRVLHNAGIVHRDIKPENIMIDQQNRIFIIDFSSAVIKGSQYAQINNQGTWGFIAPELIFSKCAADEKTDFFALGMTLKRLYNARLKELSFEAIEQIEQLSSIQPKNRKIF